MAEKSTSPTATELKILAFLGDGDAYGFDIFRHCESEFRTRAGELYILLHGLVNRRFLSSFSRLTPEGERRTYYHLTRAGEACLRRENGGRL